MTRSEYLSRSLHRKFLKICLVLGFFLVPFAIFFHSFSPFLSDNFLYDAWVSLRSEPPSSDILIVSIDEPSLQALGRWPWSRSVHAKVIDKLSAAGVRSIALDVLLVEPSHLPEDDLLLAEAMQRNGSTYLPMALLSESVLEGSDRDVLVPRPPLLSAAKGVGHINIIIDGDGVARSLELQIKRRDNIWPQLMYLIANSELANGVNKVDWPDGAIRIPFRGFSGSYPTVSYYDVLMGYVPASFLENRIVLIGMTATGLGDRYNVSLLSTGLMSGVEVHAHLLDSLLNKSYVRELNGWSGASLAGLPVFLLLLSAWLLKFRRLLLVFLLICCGVLSFSFILLFFNWWWSPSASLIMLLFAFFIIIWQGQYTLLSWFKSGLAFLYQEPPILPIKNKQHYFLHGEGLYQLSQSLEFVLERLIEGRRFILDAMHSLPLPIFILNKNGEVLLANKKALAVCLREGEAGIDNIEDLSSFLTFEGEDGFSTLWPPNFSKQCDDNAIPVGGLCTDNDGRTYRLEIGSLSTTTSSAAGGWLVWLVDLTSEVEAEAQRTTMLSFLSHDMKAPQARALALIEAQKDPDSAELQADFYNHLEKCLMAGLGMINDFIDLMRAKSLDLKSEFVLFEDVVMEALDQAYPLAKVKNIKIVCKLENEDGAPVMGDKNYLARAVFNLLENAVKYTSVGGEVSVVVFCNDKRVILQVSDNGVGIESGEINDIFGHFSRSDINEVAVGHGLGLALVKEVAVKHGGEVYCESEFGVGSKFTMTLPFLEG